uniref:Uncharacterized protein n=1 Tax=Ignisphaera aggregans TaxID=334771 RepID=A0A7J2TZT9_9CREN
MSIKFFEPITMINSLSITPSPMDRGSEPETRPEIEYQKQEDVILNLPTSPGVLALQGGEGISIFRDCYRFEVVCKYLKCF